MRHKLLVLTVWSLLLGSGEAEAVQSIFDEGTQVKFVDATTAMPDRPHRGLGDGAPSDPAGLQPRGCRLPWCSKKDSPSPVKKLGTAGRQTPAQVIRQYVKQRMDRAWIRHYWRQRPITRLPLGQRGEAKTIGLVVSTSC